MKQTVTKVNAMSALAAIFILGQSAFAMEQDNFSNLTIQHEGADIEEIQAAMMAAKDEVQLPRKVMLAAASVGVDSMSTDTYKASGDINRIVGTGTLVFRFNVDVPYTTITSARLIVNAYDVDYPANSEHDKIYFNDIFIARLTGRNGEYVEKTYDIEPRLVKCPSQLGASAVNTFKLAVNVDNNGWVTGVGSAKLEITGSRLGLRIMNGNAREGVVLRWDNIGAAEYEIYRKGPGQSSFERIAITTGTMYCDMPPEIRKPYLYYVKCGNQESPRKEGWRKGSEDRPRIESMIKSELWLSDKGPYWVRINWHDYDSSRYEITEIEFSIVPENASSKRRNCSVKQPLIRDLVSEFDLSTGNGLLVGKGNHGRYSLSANFKYRDVLTGCISSGNHITIDVGVFFEKYNRDRGGIPNWYRYWVTDNALVGAQSLFKIDRKEKFDDKFHFTDVLASPDFAAQHWGNSGWCKNHIDPGDYELPYVCKITGKAKSMYQMGDDAAAYCKKAIIVKTKEEIGCSAYGLGCAAAVIAHESMHGSLFKRMAEMNGSVYIGRYFGYAPWYSSRLKSGLSELIDELESRGWDKGGLIFDPLTKKYFDAIVAAYQSGDCFIDLDGDGVEDRAERAIGLSSTNPDTFGFGKINDTYYDHGDNEYLAYESMKSPFPVSKSRDWAFPGSQIAYDYSGEPKSKWNSDYRMSVMQNLQQLPALPNKLRFNMTKATLKATTKNSVDADHEVVVNFGRVVDMPEMATNEYQISQFSCFVDKERSGVDVVLDGSGKIESLLLRLNIDSSVTNDIMGAITGYLFDKDGVPIMWASTASTISQGGQEIVLPFSTKEIYRHRGSGCYVGYIEVYDISGDQRRIIGADVNVANCDKTYAFDDFVSPPGIMYSESIKCTQDDENVRITIDAEIRTNAICSAEIMLVDTNGNSVATAMTTNIVADGECKLCFCIDKKSIRESGYGSPYKVEYISLQSGEDELDCCDADDFSELTCECEYDSINNVILLADGVKSLSPMYGADGRIDKFRYSVLVSSMAVTNKNCNICCYVYGTNDEFVTSSRQSVCISNGINIVSLEIAGASVFESNINGPYVVRQIQIDDGDCSDIIRPNFEMSDASLEQIGAISVKTNGIVSVITDDQKDFATIKIPLKIMRCGEYSAMGILVDSDGNFVLSFSTNTTIGVAGEYQVELTIDYAKIVARGIPGPYSVDELTVHSNVDNFDYEISTKSLRNILNSPMVFVDCINGSDVSDGLKVASPKKTLASAVTSALPQAIIRVAAGDYDLMSGAGQDALLQVNKPIEIVAINPDRQKTRFLCSDKNVDKRGVWLADGASISGVTLSGFSLSADGGAGVYGQGYGSVVSNCVVSGCSATHDGGGVYQCSVYDSTISGSLAQNGGGAASCKLVRCMIEGCVATANGGGVSGCLVEDCVVRNNRANYGGGAAYGSELTNVWVTSNSGSYYGGGLYQSKATGCLIVNNSAHRGGGANESQICSCTVVSNCATYAAGVLSGSIYNSIVWGNLLTNGESDNWLGVQEACYSCTMPILSGSGNICCDPKFADIESEDYRIRISSPCLNAGSVNYVYDNRDISGNFRIHDGKTNMGCYGGVIDRLIVSVRTIGEGTITTSPTSVKVGESVAFHAEPVDRPFLGFYTNGVLATTQKDFTWSELSTDGELTAEFVHELYVDESMSSDAMDGFSRTTAKRSIQAAIDASKVGDTVYVAKGTYEGGITIDKSVTIKGEGRDVVTIDGNDEMCAFIISDGVSDVEISGFTFDKCNSIGGNGSAVYADGGLRNYVVDCTFKKCMAGSNGAAMLSRLEHGLAAVRCYFLGPYGSSENVRTQGVVQKVDLFYCVMANRRDAGYGVYGPAVVANCTFADNYLYHYSANGVQTYNSFIAGYCYKYGGADDASTNTVYRTTKPPVIADAASVGISGKCAFFADVSKCDFRMVSTCPAVGIGNKQWLSIIPKKYRTIDILGNDISNIEVINVGAFASGHTYTPATSPFCIVPNGRGASKITSKIFIDGFDYSVADNVNVDMPICFFPDNWPSFITISITPSTTNDKLWAIYGSDGVIRYPDTNGVVKIMPAPYYANSEINMKLLVVDAELYVDMSSTASNPNGTIESPFKTIQDAVDAAPGSNANSIIHIAAGVYDMGGARIESGGVMNRVCVINKHIRFIGEGVDKTFIVGAADPVASAAEYGCGANAVRCFASNGYCSLERVTLTGGHTAISTSSAIGYGGAVYGPGVSVVDSMISNNVASRASAVCGVSSAPKNCVNVIRSKVINNLSTKDNTWSCYMVSSSSLWAFNHTLIGVNRAMSVWGNNGVQIYDSSIYCVADESSLHYQGIMGAWSAGDTMRNSIFQGFGASTRYNDITGCVIDQRIPGTEIMTYCKDVIGDYRVGKNIAGYINPDRLDFRITAGSYAKDFARYDALISSNVYMYATSSLDGVWPDFSAKNGKFTAGAYRIPVKLNGMMLFMK